MPRSVVLLDVEFQARGAHWVLALYITGATSSFRGTVFSLWKTRWGKCLIKFDFSKIYSILKKTPLFREGRSHADRLHTRKAKCCPPQKGLLSL
jgi:hypothetical protein